MKATFLPELLDDLQQGPLRLLEPLAQQIFCQRVEQYWGDVVRPFIPTDLPYTMNRYWIGSSCKQFIKNVFGFLLMRK